MITITKSAQTYSATCPHCACEFNFTRADAPESEGARGQYDRWIKCPECCNSLNVTDTVAAGKAAAPPAHSEMQKRAGKLATHLDNLDRSLTAGPWRFHKASPAARPPDDPLELPRVQDGENIVWLRNTLPEIITMLNHFAEAPEEKIKS